MEFTFVDGAVALIIILSGVLAYSRGLTREVIAIAGWILAAVAALYLAPVIEPLMHDIPGIGDFFADNCVISTIAAFTIIVALSLLILSVFTPVVSTAVHDSALRAVDKVLGFVFGVLRGLLLIAVAYLVFINVSTQETVPQLETAATLPLIEESAAVIQDALPDEVPAWLGDRIDELMAACRQPGVVIDPDVPETPAEGEAADSPSPETELQPAEPDGGT